MQALFVDLGAQAGHASRRLVMWHEPSGAAPHSLVVHAHAFAEEMNKSRRMVALQAQALAERGFAVLLLDLFGCGDSAGAFEQATWQGWLSDLHAACAWGLERLRQTGPGQSEPADRRNEPAVRINEPAVWLWGLRAGCLLANALAAQAPCGRRWNQLLWQPQPLGKTALNQFTRLKTAAGGLQGGDAKAVAQAMKDDFAAGRAVEIAGYWLAAEMAQGLEQAKLQVPGPGTRSIWLETSTRETPELLPASSTAVQTWASAGAHIESRAVAGPAFWTTTEIEDAPDLIAATCALLAPAHQALGVAS